MNDFLDSYAPIDGEVCTADPWPLPPVKPWGPKTSLREQSKALLASLWQRFKVWLIGGEAK
jgi:hypothetical protein